MRCENWEEGLFTVEGPDGMERTLRSLFWYDGPRIFLFPHEGRIASSPAVTRPTRV